MGIHSHPKKVTPVLTVPPKRKRKPMGIASYVEFQVVVLGGAYSVEQLNEWGREGWELAGFAITPFNAFHYVFQRKV